MFTAHHRREMRKELLRARSADAQAMLEAAGEPGSSSNLHTVWSDDIAGWVAQELTAKPVDLVVKTVHKSKTLLHTPLDWELLRSCPAPVLLTTSRRKKRSGKILAAIDLNHDDAKHRRLNLRVLNAARLFAGFMDAEIHVVAVTTMSPVLHDLDIIDEYALEKRVKKKTKLRLSALLSPYEIPQKHVHQPVGNVGSEVASCAHKLKADLLVVGTSVHRVKQAVGLGNSAERILQKAPCDLLAVHP